MKFNRWRHPRITRLLERMSRVVYPWPRGRTGVTFTATEMVNVGPCSIELRDGDGNVRGSIREGVDILLRSGNSLVLSLNVTLFGDDGAVVFDKLCRLLPADRAWIEDGKE